MGVILTFTHFSHHLNINTSIINVTPNITCPSYKHTRYCLYSGSLVCWCGWTIYKKSTCITQVFFYSYFKSSYSKRNWQIDQKMSIVKSSILSDVCCFTFLMPSIPTKVYTITKLPYCTLTLSTSWQIRTWSLYKMKMHWSAEPLLHIELLSSRAWMHV